MTDTTTSHLDEHRAHGEDAPGGRRRIGAWWHGGLAVLAFAVAPDGGWSHAAYLVAVTAAAIVMVVVTRRGDRMAPWRWVAASLVLNCAGDWFRALQQAIESDAFGWYALDLLYFAAYLCLVRALLMLARHRERTPVVDRLIELWSILVVLGLVVWVVLVEPALNSAGRAPIEQLIAVTYPLFALSLVGLTIWVFLVRGRRGEPGLIPLGVGLVIWLVTDVAFSVSARSEIDPGTAKALDLGWLAGTVLIALACVEARHHIAAKTAATPRRAGWARVAVGTMLILIPMVVHAIRDVEHGGPPPYAALVSTGALTALSVARMLRLRSESDEAWTLLRSSERRARALAANSSDAVLVVDAAGKVLHGHDDLRRLLGSELSMEVGTPTWPLIDPRDHTLAAEVLQRCVDAPGEVFSTELRVVLPGTEPRWYSFRAVNRVDDPDLGGIVINVHDVDERRRAQHELEHRASHDSLTGLPNRARFHERVGHSLRSGRARERSSAVLFIDLDGFKSVNDSLGHDAGDHLLQVVADRLRRVTPAEHTVARLGGDEFAVLIERAPDLLVEARTLAGRMLDALGAPVPVQGQQLHPRASIGIALSDPGDEAATVLRHADLAMYEAKASGRNRWVVFEPQMETELEERLRIEHDLAGGIAEGQFRLQYQPVVHLASGRLLGFEALVRWEHPALGCLGADRFVPVAESTGMIVPIGAWVLEEACAVLARWRRELPQDPPLGMSVNVSAKQLADPGFVELVHDVLVRNDLQGRALVLELTETSLITQPELVAERLADLKGLGVRLAIDDFGTGYSSLNHLRRFPVDIVKIDREFTQMIESGDAVPPIVRGLLELSRTLGLDVVAEGIETAAQVEGLRSQGCRAGQGYHFARPLDERDAEVVLAGSLSRS